MAEGGSSNAGAGASAGAGAGTGAGAASSEAGTGEAAVTTKSGESAEAGAGESKKTKQVSEKAGEVIDGKTVTVQEVKDKTTINKDHVEGEKKKEKEEVKKHKYADRLAKAFPDRTFETDEDYENAHEEHVKNLEGYRDRGIVVNQKLVDLIEAEPQIRDVISEMIEGATMRSALAKHIGAEDLVPEEGDPDYKAYEENNKQRLERIAKADQFNREFNENVEFSAKSVQEFATENNLNPEEAEKILGEFDNMLKDIYRGRITKETLAKIVRAVKHDEAVKEAKEEAKIEGRNEAIKEKIAKEDKSAQDDGLPVLKKSGDATEETPEVPKEQQIIDRIFETSKKRSNF